MSSLLDDRKALMKFYQLQQDTQKKQNEMKRTEVIYNLLVHSYKSGGLELLYATADKYIDKEKAMEKHMMIAVIKAQVDQGKA